MGFSGKLAELKRLARARAKSAKKLKILLKFNLTEARAWFVRIRRSIRAYWIETPLRQKLINGFIIVFGAAVAAGGFVSLQDYSGVRAQQEFQRPARKVADFLINSIERHISPLNTAAKKFTGKKSAPSRWTFFSQTKKALPDYPGIQALEWIPRVSARYRKRYEKLAAKDGLYTFAFLGPDGRAAPKGAKDAVHFPIFYVEPFSGNESALGYDLATNPAALDVLRRAGDLGTPVTSNLTRPEGGGGAQNGIVVTIPVYRSEILPFTVAERRRELRGFIRGVIRFDRLMLADRSNLVALSGFRVLLYSHQKGADPRLLYHSGAGPEDGALLPFPKASDPGDIHVAAKFKLAEQEWTMIVRPESNWLTSNLSGTAAAFVTFTLLLTALLLLHLVVSQARTRAIERTVAERTASLRTEIAQRRQVENDLREATDEAESANRAKSEFLAVMSHELRTPLNAVIGFADMMSQELYGELGHENYRQYSSFIRDSADHLLSLINDILDLSKIEADRYELRKEAVGIADIWRSVHDMLGEWLTSAKLELSTNLDDSPLFILADGRALRQILLNLLSNAIKFTPAGGLITVNAQIDEAGKFILWVRDSGIGISDDDLAAVFEPFRQLDSSVSKDHEGTGLGLPLTQRLAALHGAQLDIDSALGRGTTVCVVFAPDSVVNEDGSAKPIAEIRAENVKPPAKTTKRRASRKGGPAQDGDEARKPGKKYATR